MKERSLFQEIPGRRNDFHSAILTSYSFNFHHFEYQVLRVLRQKWITNVAVLVDQHMLDGSIGLASGNLKQLSRSYSVNGIKSTGAFHPKINFLVGDNKLLLFFGSGNITPGGHGKNHELFTIFYADSIDSKQLPILQEAWRYLEGLTKDVAGHNKERIGRQVVSNSSLLGKPKGIKHAFYTLDEAVEVALLYNDSSSVFSQLAAHIPAHQVSRISIVCPYFDEDGATLLALAEYFDQAILDVYLPEEFGLPPLNMQYHDRVNFHKWEATKRGKKELSGKGNYRRKLHSKVFHFEAEDYEYLMLGSANATRAGIGDLTHKGSNEEFCSLYKSTHINFPLELGIKGKKKVDIKSLSRSVIVAGDEGQKAGYQNNTFIKGADLRGNNLEVYLKSNSQSIETNLGLYNSQGEELYQIEISAHENDKFTHNLPSEVVQKELTYVELTGPAGNSISNKQLINYLDKLYLTDPSKANRSINQIINGLETGTVNEFEILAYLNDVNQVKDLTQSKGTKLGARKDKSEDNPTVGMTYDEAVEAAKNPLNREKVVRSHNSVRLWESISKMLSDSIQRRDDELENEEEDGSAEESHLRKNDPPPPRTLAKGMKVEQLVSQVKRLAQQYKASVSRIKTENHQIDVIDLVQFLLVTHIITALTYFNKGEAFRQKKGEGYTDPNWQFKLRDTFRFEMKEVLTSFNKLLILCELKRMKHEADEYTESKVLDYRRKTVYNSMLYLHLIDTLNSEPFMNENLELLAFNVFNRLDLTGSKFEQYLDDISRTEDETMFNASSVIHLQNKLEKEFVKLGDNDNFFRIDHSGWCKVKERNEYQVRYKSIYGIGRISKSKYRKYKSGQ